MVVATRAVWLKPIPLALNSVGAVRTMARMATSMKMPDPMPATERIATTPQNVVASPVPPTPRAVIRQPAVRVVRSERRDSSSPAGMVAASRPIEKAATAHASPTAPTSKPSMYSGRTGVAAPWPRITTPVPKPSSHPSRPMGERRGRG